jgi:hypothetical protein
MKRDMDLIRKIVFAIEELPHHHLAEPIKIDGYDDEFVGFQWYLMMEAGLIKGFDATGRGTSPQAIPFWLTWAGYEFADSARNDSIWQMAKKTIKDNIGSVSMALLTELLKHLGKQAIGVFVPGSGIAVDK